jgi:hypothetical protein
MEFNRINPLTGEVASSASAMKAGVIPGIMKDNAARLLGLTGDRGESLL